MPRTRVLVVDPNHPDPAAIAEAASVIRAGGLVAFPTETVYGLGADATNPEAVARIFKAKRRPATNPLIVHVARTEAAPACVAAWPDSAEVLAERFWPGPLTLVLPRSGLIPDIVTAGQETVGVRVPGLAVARRLIFEAGRPIAAPSANRSTGISPTEARHVLKDLEGRVDLILDGGRTSVGIESTVLDLSSEVPRILRPGAITQAQVSEILGEPVEYLAGSTEPGLAARGPGQMAIHYAPRTPAFRLEFGSPIPPPDLVRTFVTIGFGDGSDDVDRWLPDPESAARDLYATLHELDALGLDFLLIVPPPDEPRWRAIRDRIRRATRPWPSN